MLIVIYLSIYVLQLHIHEKPVVLCIFFILLFQSNTCEPTFKAQSSPSCRQTDITIDVTYMLHSLPILNFKCFAFLCVYKDVSNVIVTAQSQPREFTLLIN